MAFANADDAAELTALLKTGVISAAKVTHVHLTTYDNQYSPQDTAQNATLIAQAKPDVVIDSNPVAGIYPVVQRTFQNAGIPHCIASNTPPSNPATSYCKWFNLSNPILCGDTAKAVGTVAQEKGWTGKNTSVLLLNLPAAGEQINSCNGYFYKELTNWIPGLPKIKSAADITLTTTKLGSTVFQADGQATRSGGFTAAQTELQLIPKSRHLILYTVSDDSTLGAWQAIKDAGRAKTALTAGLGGTPEAYQAFRSNPGWVAEGDSFFGEWGEYFMAMASALKSGVKVPFQTLAPEAVLTKDFSVPNSTVVPVADYYRKGQTTPFKLPPLQNVAVGQTVFGQHTVGNGYLAQTGVLQKFNNVDGLTAK